MQHLLKSFVALLICYLSSTSYLFAENEKIRSRSEIIDAIKCQNNSVSMADLVIRNSIFYEKFSDEPFCGKIKKYGLVLEGKREGKWTVYHENGQLNAKVFFKKGKKIGIYEQFTETGLAIAIGPYKNDKKHGAWFETDRSAKKRTFIKNIGYYADGKRDGEWNFYYEEDRKCSTSTYQNGKLHGKFESLFRDGELSLRGEYATGKVVGVWETYHPETPHHLCSKGDFSKIDRCQFITNGKALIIDPFVERTMLLAQIDFLSLMRQNSCVLITTVPSIFN